jgi:hypothetical protein
MERAKARKDIDQAAQLLRVLTDERPGDIAPAWRAARKRGKNWERRLTQARAELPADVQSALAELEVDRDTQ